MIHALDVPLIGLNCATGPAEMSEHVKWLAENWPGLISVQPNAGLPELVNGATRYPLLADELANWLERFVRDDGLNLVGGCCGTNIPHIQATDAMLQVVGQGLVDDPDQHLDTRADIRPGRVPQRLQGRPARP